jgi:catechol 2,3-dioxygenase
VHLIVADLERSAAWYERSLGLRVHARAPGRAALGDGAEPTVVLHEDPEARPAGRHAGLYHVALLFGSREELARAAVRLAATATPVDGASDHRTHEAIYLRDPDGNGLELAADRPREAWPDGLGYDGGPAPLDVDDLLAAVAGEAPAPRAGEGLRVGHVHLHVGDLTRAAAFYRDVLGFAVQADLGSALFVSAGGYHHHVGLNVWRGVGVGAPPPHTAGLREWTVQLPTAADVDAVAARAAAAGLEPERRDGDGALLVRDPWGTVVAVVATERTGRHARAVVATERPSPYLLQLAKHFRHKLDVAYDAAGTGATIPFAFGVARATAGDGRLVLDAHAHTAADLARLERVVGSHLERFGRRDELEVRWERDA